MQLEAEKGWGLNLEDATHQMRQPTCLIWPYPGENRGRDHPAHHELEVGMGSPLISEIRQPLPPGAFILGLSPGPVGVGTRERGR